MTREEFARVEHDPCQTCGARVGLEHNPNNNAIRVVCSNPHCVNRRRPWGLVINLKHSAKTRRLEYPPGHSLDEVWERFGNACIICGVTRSECEVLGIGRERQHTLEYVKTGHEGPILPICGHCHPIATNLQRLRAFLRRTLSTHHGDDEPDARGGAGVPASRLPRDPLRPAREAAVGALEGLSDDDADA